jgi:hypothetical protein
MRMRPFSFSNAINKAAAHPNWIAVLANQESNKNPYRAPPFFLFLILTKAMENEQGQFVDLYVPRKW